MSQSQASISSSDSSILDSIESSKSSLSSSSQSQTLSQDESQGQGQGEDQQGKRKTDILCTPVQHKHKRLQQLQKAGGMSPALKIPASPLMTRLGYGTGVGVFLLERSPKPSGEIRSPWAIKKIAGLRAVKNPADKIYAARLEHEASILKKLSHPNIIGYRGFVTKSSSTFPALALEKASTCLANLIEFRFDEMMESVEMNPNPFPAQQIEKVALDVAKALDYLHNEMSMIHGDLKSGNVLIFGDFEIVKLCDFGVSRKLKEDGTLDGFYVGTEIWNPKEVMEEKLASDDEKKFPITAKVEMYPFGLTIFEMISLKPPHIGTNVDNEESLNSSLTETDPDGNESSVFDENAYEDMLSARIGSRPPLPDIEFDQSYNKILEILYCCTEEDPGKRPTPKHVVELLEEPPAATAICTSPPKTEAVESSTDIVSA